MNELVKKAEKINSMYGKCALDWEKELDMKYHDFVESMKPNIDGYVFLKDKNLKVKLGIEGDIDSKDDAICGYLREAYFSVGDDNFLPYSHFSEEYTKRVLEEGELMKEKEKLAKEQEKVDQKDIKEEEKKLKKLKKEYEAKASMNYKNSITVRFHTYAAVEDQDLRDLELQFMAQLERSGSFYEKYDSFDVTASHTKSVSAIAKANNMPIVENTDMLLNSDQFDKALKLIQTTQKAIKECHHDLLAIRGELDEARQAKMDDILATLQGMEHAFLDKVSNPICGKFEESAMVEAPIVD